MWLTSSRLFLLAGPALYRDSVESKESLSRDDLGQILRSPHLYTAVVKDEQLMSLISRWRLALLIAQELAAKSEIESLYLEPSKLSKRFSLPSRKILRTSPAVAVGAGESAGPRSVCL